MKKLRLDTILFIILILIIGFANLVNPNKPTISITENRSLEKKPTFSLSSFFKGDYTHDYSTYYSDTFILREPLIEAKSQVKKSFTIAKDIKIVIDQDPEHTYNSSPTGSPLNTENPGPSASSIPVESGVPPTPTDSPILEPEYIKAQVIEVLKPPFFLVDDHVVAAIWASDSSLERYASFVNEFKASMGKDVNVYSMVTPTSMEYYDLKDLQYITGSQKKMVEHINSYTNDDVIDVDIYGALFSHCKEYVYYRTDHHWTHLGAYYAYTELMTSMGRIKDIVPLSDYTKKEEIEGYIGSAYKKTDKDERVLKNSDTLTAYYPIIDYTFTMYKKDTTEERRLNDLRQITPNNPYYNMFMSGGSGIYHEFTTTNKNGKTFLLICDSYGASLVHFLLPHYEKVYVMDTRYYDREYLNFMTIDQFAKSINANDIAVLQYMDSVAYSFNTDVLYSLLTLPIAKARGFLLPRAKCISTIADV